ncbi:Tn3 family transposase [Streptomyces triculaminicus]|uniref:Tn3 family transposase n=1 Tax=Streptomyces triculaminicus TaxID=2816232 RepID=UPI0033EEA20F
MTKSPLTHFPGNRPGAVVWWNTLYIDAAVKKLEAGGVTISPEIRSRLSPLVHEHINFHGRYPIIRSHDDSALRPLRDQDRAEERNAPGGREGVIPKAGATSHPHNDESASGTHKSAPGPGL